MKLYKFRSLGDCESLCRAERILETSQFWCSRFWEMNDPMEGVYRFPHNQLPVETIRKLYSEKSRQVICSFSAKQVFSKPQMWGYYTDGFKGIAIELEVKKGEVRKVDYKKDLEEFAQGDDTVQRILTTKLKCWSHEQEYRYLAEGKETGYHSVGRITGVYFGFPFRTLVNAQDAESRPRVQNYLRRARALAEHARNLNIPCHGVDIEDLKVVPKEMDWMALR